MTFKSKQLTPNSPAAQDDRITGEWVVNVHSVVATSSFLLLVAMASNLLAMASP